jgi:hypothetical protein
MLAGGVESISLVQANLNLHHFTVARVTDPADPNKVEYQDNWIMENKPELFLPMITTADIVAKRYNVSREALDTERAPDSAGKQWRIDVTLAKSAPVGPVADHVVVRTNHPQQKVVEIPVSGFVRPMVAVTPPSVNFGQVDPAESQEWGILVRNFGSVPLLIEDVESSVAGLDVKVESLRDGEQYRLVFTPTAEMPKGPFQGTAEVRTNLPQQPSLSVEVRGEIR